ncbi:MAG: UDP-glucose/GDP-mannose dehydrogenase family protein, partial [Desulfovibrionaceae bacterium]|nr:UDP-glucose/GDP-mannose dehydrogenase family protein [Desulfovibrionaceae bacterium]
LAAKISFINEMASICEKVGADIREVRVGIGSDHRIGYHFIYPGVGYGGSCFPKDVKALIHTAREAGAAPCLLEAVEDVNARQKKSMAKKILAYFGGDVAGKTLALWGLAFKANTNDMREAASLEIISELTARGMKIRAFDPVAGENAQKLLAGNALFALAQEQYDALNGADALLVVTEWNQFRTPDLEKIRNTLSCPVIFDGRNLYSPEHMQKAGFKYFCIGVAPKSGSAG